MDIVGSDLSKAVDITKDLKHKSYDVLTHVQNLIKRVSDEDISTAKGVSFLEMKNHVLLSYLINLTHLMLQKSSGKSIDGIEDIDRLVELRVVLEKLRPIDHKLTYQIDKLTKTATTGSLAADDPLRYKPNPDNLVSQLDEDEEDPTEAADSDKVAKPKVYRPPKLSAMHYDGDDSVAEKDARKMERAKKRALSSSVIQELRQEYHEGPEEIRDDFDLHRGKVEKKMKERMRYEEDNFVRMQLTKKDISSMQKVRTVSSLGDLTRFSDIRALTGEGRDSDDEDMPRKKRKLTNKKGKGKGKKKGKRFKK